MNLSRGGRVVKHNVRVTFEVLAGMDPPTAARRLLGSTITAGKVTLRIVEVEAYGSDPAGPWPDPAAHSFRGPTPRNKVMFGPAGVLYVYRSYGIHHCINVTTGPDAVSGAVLLRGATVIGGLDEAWSRRPTARNAAALARGPGNLAASLGIQMSDNGTRLFEGGRIALALGGADAVEVGPRVGISVATEVPWRFWIPGAEGVSAYRRSPRAPRLAG